MSLKSVLLFTDVACRCFYCDRTATELQEAFQINAWGYFYCSDCRDVAR